MHRGRVGAHREEPHGRGEEVEESAGDLLHLVKTDSPRPVWLEKIQEGTAVFGQGVALPPTGTHPLWVRFDLSPSLKGRLANLLFRSPPVYLEVTTPCGAQRYRLTPGQAQSGFLLSPVIRSNEHFALLLTGHATQQLAEHHVAAFTLITSNVSYYEATVPFTLYELRSFSQGVAWVAAR